MTQTPSDKPCEAPDVIYPVWFAVSSFCGVELCREQRYLPTRRVLMHECILALRDLTSLYLEAKVAQLSMHFTTCTSISAFL